MADFILGRLKFVWKGEWAASTDYVKDDVVQYDGQSYVCVDVHESSADFADDKATKWELMAGGVSYKGNWDNTETYSSNNLVTYAGSTWISAQDDNINHTPTSGSSVWWVLFSQGAIELTTVGDILYRDTAGPTRLGIGSENSILQVSSAGKPEWVIDLDVPNNLGVGNNLTVTGTATITSDAQINGGNITSLETEFNLLNTTVTTLNIGGAATTVSIGAGTGTTTVNNDLSVSDDLDVTGTGVISGVIYKGATAVAQATTDSLTDTSAVFVSEAEGFNQIAHKNTSNADTASTDFIAYADNGDNDTGWIDMGITSSTFADATYGVTGPNDGYIFMSAPTGTTGNGNLYLSTSGNGAENDIVFSTGGFTSGQEKMRLTDADHDGFNKGLNLMDDVSTTAGAFYVGPDAKSLTQNSPGYAGLTHVTGLFVDDVDDFVQFAIKNINTGSSASTDLIAYASDGDNDSGWIDLGITSETFSDPAFTVTGPGTGYLFFSAPVATSGTGDLLIGTDANGSQADIVFFTNGFDAGNERLRIIGVDRIGTPAGVEIYADTESTTTTTGALRVDGGIGLLGNLNVGGDVNIVGNITLGGTGNTVETESLSVADPIIRMANGNTASDSVDIGFVGTYASSGTKYTGLVRDASDGMYKLFTGLTVDPTTTVDFTSASYADLKLNNLDFITGAKIKINGSAGTDGKFLKTTSSGMEWADAAVTVSDDTATSSGLNLLFTSSTSGTITSASVTSTKLSFVPSTGALRIKGTLALQGSSSGAVTFQVPATAGSATYTLPSADGTNGYALVTNGSGTLSWAAAGASITATTTNATFYPVFASSSSGSLTTANVNTGFTYNASTGLLTVTSLTESSSIALKENINPISNGLDAIMKLVGVTYDRRDGTKQNEAGLIAESVNLILPNLVSKDADGNPDGIHYSKLTAYLIEAIKELKAEINELKGNK